MRGNPVQRLGVPGFIGSIPARAGEPLTTRRRRSPSEVYPRACGGTYAYAKNCGLPKGLSPRVRGNHAPRLQQVGTVGSIPARAGEPLPASRTARGIPVYPRACGGTGDQRRRLAHAQGLSPRVRGNRHGVRLGLGRSRSIPARAGEPVGCVDVLGFHRVYPRACGGTLSSTGGTGSPSGLSPRVRGNRRRGRGPHPQAGSIPARAGEPALRASTSLRYSVYPRACGGTPVTRTARPSPRGLSPRVRGNHHVQAREGAQLGSIPARAGEPFTVCCRILIARVYPRACGGTGRYLRLQLSQ